MVTPGAAYGALLGRGQPLGPCSAACTWALAWDTRSCAGLAPVLGTFPLPPRVLLCSAHV